MRFSHAALLSAGLLLFCAAAPLTASADVYSYTFNDTAAGPGGAYTTGFTYDSDGLISTNTVFTPLTCSINYASYGACTTAEIDPSTGLVQIGYTSGSTVSLSPFPASFFQVGNNTLGADFSMDIADLGASPTPEPSSFILLGTGLLGVCGVLRRRLV